jgi:hypothetical protein
MQIICIDYSEIYYSEIAKIPVPDRLTGKFVQVRHNNTEYLIFSPKEFTPYHADLVKRFCKEKGLKGSLDRTSKYFEISDPAWVVVGGGKYEVDKKKKFIRLHDNSMAYGRFDRRGLKAKVLSMEFASDYVVVIE